MKDEIRRSIRRLSSPEQIDQMLNLAQPIPWYPIVCVFILIIATLVWSFVGRIPTEVTGRGISLSPKGVFSIQSNTNGTVTDIRIAERDVLKAGDYIATIYNPKQKAILTEIESTLFKIVQLEKELVMLEERLVSRQSLYEEGLVAKTVVEDTQSNVYVKQIAIEDSKAKIENLLSELEETSSAGHEEAFDKEEVLETLKSGQDLQKLEDQLSKVYAPADGTVLEVLVDEGDLVDKKRNLVWMEYPKGTEEKELFYTYLPVQFGSKVLPDMPVRIEPAIVNPREYGSILGTVKEVSPYTVSEEEMLATLRNRQLVNYMMEGSPAVVEVIVKPEVDETTASGYAWTSKDGPPFRIPTGTVCEVKITVEEQPPISYLIPLWKIKPTYEEKP
ncbi:MAG: hypothetical protein K940chlam7_01461 [Chlamydiae bacterium]|nr:hypothetical protein [Chlamydiota bacterium]